ncbi:MAG: XRE family transcriptional regulator [Gammaproteobacteria bacterium]|mgnify:CR=1 FL=1|nr:XRE family transcriptional regulator [Gammaproteobacteria bacterium]
MKIQQTTNHNVFDDLAFSASEAANLKIRAALMRAIEQELVKRKLTQAKAAKILCITQPRISDLKRGKIQLFTVDSLINMLGKLDKPVSIIIDDRLAA